MNHPILNIPEIVARPAFTPEYYVIPDDEIGAIYSGIFMFHMFLPFIYIVFSTGSFTAILYLWSLIESDIFEAFHSMKQILTNIVIYIMRMLGWYTVSTYTVVKDGREVFSATSEYFFMKTTRANIKNVDPAKYKVCKWIDNECVIYRRVNNDEEPELTETHNDIYDFIIHKCEHDTLTRIHRGDFRISTHTLSIENYRKFCKSYQICDSVELHISQEDGNTEVIVINMKYPNQYYLEKNILLDKKFLRWYLYSKLCRKDLADYIGLPCSKYEIHVYYQDFMTNMGRVELATPSTTDVLSRSRVFTVNDGQYILVGNRYIVKVDSVLGCPVFESVDKDVYHVDDDLTNYYENSVCSDTDNGYDTDEDGDEDADEAEIEAEAETEAEDDESAVTDDEAEAEADADTESEASLPDPEFEVIEPSTD
jgi:hypothetical protein